MAEAMTKFAASVGEGEESGCSWMQACLSGLGLVGEGIICLEEG